MGQRGLFDTDEKLSELTKMGDPLIKLDEIINWGIFRRDIEKAFEKERKSNAGRPPFDYLMMFKVLVLQTIYGISDAQTQYQILDRHTFKRFLKPGGEDKIPDEKTIWHFREVLTSRGVIRILFDKFDKYLNKSGYSAKKGQIIDASFVEVPRQRNKHSENDTIKKGDTPSEWKDKPNKMRQKDVDARWTKKNNESHYGYKNHINVDAKHKLIRKYEVTPANVHDSQVLDGILDKRNSLQALWADSAYSSHETDRKLKKKKIGNHIHRKGTRKKGLSEFQQRQNKKKSSIRVRVEHIFGAMTWMTGMYIRCIGSVRSADKIGIMNLVYNMKRYTYLARTA